MLARVVPSGRLLAGAAGWLVVYAVATVWLTWPLAMVLGTHFPDVQAACRFDAPLLAWSLGHQAQSLLSAPATFAHPPILHPTPLALYYGETGTGALPLFLPVYALTRNAVLASNVTLVAGVALTALGLHLVTWRWTRSHAAGAVAASVFLTSRWLLWEWPPCAPNYAVLCLFPWIVALAARPSAARERPALLAVLIAAQAAVTAYVAVALFAPLTLLGALRCATRRRRATGLWLLGVLAAAALLVAPVFAGFALVGVGVAISLTPEVFWLGERVRLPYADLPLYSALRVTIRLAVGGLIGFCLLAALALDACARPLARLCPPALARALGPALAVLVASVVLAERRSGFNPFAVRTEGSAFRSFAVHEAPSAPALSALLRHASGAVVELPASVSGLPVPEWNVAAMLRSLEHGRPVLNGYHGYWPRRAAPPPRRVAPGPGGRRRARARDGPPHRGRAPGRAPAVAAGAVAGPRGTRPGRGPAPRRALAAGARVRGGTRGRGRESSATTSSAVTATDPHSVLARRTLRTSPGEARPTGLNRAEHQRCDHAACRHLSHELAEGVPMRSARRRSARRAKDAYL